MDDAQRKKLSEALKAKWASGTRKKNPPETYVKSSATHKKAFADGTRKRPTLTSERAKEIQSMVDKEKLAEINRRIGLDNIGVPMPPGPSARGPGHWKAKYFILKAPTGEIIHGWNLAELIRTHRYLIDEEYLEEYTKDGRCKTTIAYKRLHHLFEIRKSTGQPYAHSWKGWTALASFDEAPSEIVNFPIWKK